MVDETKTSWLAWVVVAALSIVALLLAFFLRFYHLGQVPPALNGDEAVFGSGALELLEHGPRLYFEGQGGGGVLASYIVAAAFLVDSPGKMPLRFQASLVGALTVMLLLFTVPLLFNAEHKPYRSWFIAAVAALFMAVNYNHVTISRVAFAVVHLPFLELLAVWGLWLAQKRQKLLWFALAGGLLSLVMYGYIAGIVLPAMVGLFAFIQVAMQVRNILKSVATKNLQSKATEIPRYTRNDMSRLFKFHLTVWPYLEPWLVYGLAFLAGVLPLVWFYLANPQTGTARMGETSFLNPLVNHGNPLGALWYGVWGNATAYGLAPLNWLVQKQWMMFVGHPRDVAAFAGIAIALWRVKYPAYRFVLLWWAFTILPAALAPTEVPYATRAIGVFAPYCLFAGLATVEFGAAMIAWGAKLTGRFRRGLVILVVAVLLWLVGMTAQNSWRSFNYYFKQFPTSKQALAGYDEYAIHLVEDMASLAQPGAAFVLTRSTSAGSVSPNGTVNFLYRLKNSPSPHYWVTDDESTLPGVLTDIVRTADLIYVVTWNVTKHTGADPKLAFAYYLEKYGAFEHRYQFAEYTITAYRLPQTGIDFSAAETLSPTNVNLGNALTLQGFAFGNAGPGDVSAQTVSAGQPVWVRLRWQKQADYPQDLKVSVVLQTPGGQWRVLAVDKYLQNNILHRRFTGWPVGETADTYFLLALPPDLMPGDYSLVLQLYAETEGGRLDILPNLSDGGQMVDLGLLAVAPSVAVPPVSSLPDWPVIGVVDGLSLRVDAAAVPNTMPPGQALALPVVWRADAPLLGDFTIQLALQGNNGDPLTLLSPQTIGGAAYPATTWRSGEILRQNFELFIPPGVNGNFTLAAIVKPAGQSPVTWPIKPVTVQDWPHTATLPGEAIPLAVNFADGPELAGYATRIFAGSNTLELTLYWRAGNVILQPYTEFVHLLLPNGSIAAQMDHPPTDGVQPMPGWFPGEIIADTVSLAIPVGVDPAMLRVSVGLYHAQTWKRLPVTVNNQTSDHVVFPVVITERNR